MVVREDDSEEIAENIEGNLKEDTKSSVSKEEEIPQEEEDNLNESFKSFLLGSQDLKVNLCGLQQDIRSDGKSKKIVGIARQFPCYSYTVGPYGKGPTGNYTTCTYNS